MRIAIVSLLLLAVACGSQVAASDQALEECIAALVEHRHDLMFGATSIDFLGTYRASADSDLVDACAPFIKG